MCLPLSFNSGTFRICMRLNIVFMLTGMRESCKFCVKEILSCDYIYYVSPLFIGVAVVFQELASNCNLFDEHTTRTYASRL